MLLKRAAVDAAINAMIDAGLNVTFEKAKERINSIYLASLTFAESFYSGMIYLTRLEHFNAAHKLYNAKWSREQNEEVFGVCANENWHGHNFDLYVTVKGEPNPDTGFVMDVKKLKLLIKEHVIKKVDHKNLNLDVDFLQGKTCNDDCTLR